MTKRQVIYALAAISAVLFVAGMFAAYRSRHDTICKNGKPPVAQRGEVIGQTEYRCSDGTIVKK